MDLNLAGLVQALKGVCATPLSLSLGQQHSNILTSTCLLLLPLC